MRHIWLTMALLLGLGISTVGVGCDNEETTELINKALSMFSSSLPDANGDGVPEVPPGTVIEVTLNIADAGNCDVWDSEPTGATITYTIEEGTIDDVTDTETGPDSVCNADERFGEWTVPTAAGNYAVTITFEVTFADGSHSSDELSGEIEVTA